VLVPGSLRATVGPGETFLCGPNIFTWPLWRESFWIFFSKWYILAYRTLYFWPTARPPNVAGPGVAYPHTPPSRRAWLVRCLDWTCKSQTVFTDAWTRSFLSFLCGCNGKTLTHSLSSVNQMKFTIEARHLCSNWQHR